MNRKPSIVLLTCFFQLVVTSNSYAKAATPAPTSLYQILNLPADKREKEIIRLFYNKYFYSSAFDRDIPKTLDSLQHYRIPSATGLGYFAQILILRRLRELEKAEQLLLKGISLARKEKNSYLLYNFYLTLAFNKTDKREELQAIYNYRQARREASKLRDKILLASTDLGLASVYESLELFDQAFIYSNQISTYCTENSESDKKFLFFSYVSKAITFFMMKKADSLKYYTEKANHANKEAYHADKDLERLRYFNLIMAGKNQEAIAAMETFLEANKPHWTLDKLDLANCYFQIGLYYKAANLAQNLISPGVVKTLPIRVKINAHVLLGEIAQQLGDEREFLTQQVAALSESEKYINNITRVADLSYQIQLDQMDIFYQVQTSVYKKERIILMFSLLAVALGALIIGIFYHGIRQKRKYEKLLQESRDKELLFLNSHRTRKHLANILGLCTLVQAAEPDKSDLLLYFDYVSNAATEMDEWLQEVNKKLTAESKQ